MLGDLGLAGFLVYMALLVTGFLNARWLNRETRARPDLEWMADLGRMLQVSMVTFCVSGAALSMAFYDYFLSLLIVLSTVRLMAVKALGERKPARAVTPRAKLERDPEVVDTTAIAGIWQKAAHKKVSRLQGKHRTQRLASTGGPTK